MEASLMLFIYYFTFYLLVHYYCTQYIALFLFIGPCEKIKTVNLIIRFGVQSWRTNECNRGVMVPEGKHEHMIESVRFYLIQ